MVTMLALAVVSPSMIVAQATRTWVSGVGDDANPCSRTAPCKTFAGAISKTAPNGEINCIDPGGFGALTITKSITVDCSDVEAGVLVAGTNGFIINALSSDRITIRGLDFEGAGTGLDGIRVLSAAAVHISDVVIRGFRGSNGNGIDIAASTNVKVFINDSLITDNGVSATTGGILLRPTGTGTANVSIDNVDLENNSAGIIADGSATTGSAVNVVIRGSVSSANSNGGFVATTTAGHAAINAQVQDSQMSSNAGAGVSANGTAASGLGSAIVRVGDSVISLNVTGISSIGSGQVRSYLTNQVNGNGGGETFAGTDPLK
jgi:hypothetical protein